MAEAIAAVTLVVTAIGVYLQYRSITVQGRTGKKSTEENSEA